MNLEPLILSQLAKRVTDLREQISALESQAARIQQAIDGINFYDYEYHCIVSSRDTVIHDKPTAAQEAASIQWERESHYRSVTERCDARKTGFRELMESTVRRFVHQNDNLPFPRDLSLTLRFVAPDADVVADIPPLFLNKMVRQIMRSIKDELKQDSLPIHYSPMSGEIRLGQQPAKPAEDLPDPSRVAAEMDL